jgi:hypothetical protein
LLLAVNDPPAAFLEREMKVFKLFGSYALLVQVFALLSLRRRTDGRTLKTRNPLSWICTTINLVPMSISKTSSIEFFWKTSSWVVSRTFANLRHIAL